MQRVWPFRWVCPTSQTVFQVDYAELERVHAQARAEYDVALDKSAAAAAGQVELELPMPERDRTGPGGRTHRKPPELHLLAGCAAPEPTRLEIDTGEWRDGTLVADASAEELAKRVIWAVNHRGRPGGMRPEDYAAQRELTVARSLTWQFFKSCREFPGAPLAWHERFGDAARILGFLLWARRLGRQGITLSGPQWEAVLKVSLSSVWRYLRKLERAGFIIRLRRYKPGRGGLPVGLTSNWYALGPAAIASLSDAARPGPIVKRRRADARRRHLRAEGRRRGVSLVPGGTFPPLEEYLDLSLRACVLAQARDDLRVMALLAGDAPTDFTTAQLPAFVIQIGELAPVETPVQTEAPGAASFQARTRARHSPRATTQRRHRRKVQRPLPISEREEAAQVEPVTRAQQLDGDRAIAGIHGRESTPRACSYPMSARHEPPLEGLKPVRYGPEARDVRPPLAAPEPRQRPAVTRGPLTEAVSADDSVFMGTSLRWPSALRAAVAELAGTLGASRDTVAAGDVAHTPNTGRNLRPPENQPLDVRAVAPPGADSTAGRAGADGQGGLADTLLDDCTGVRDNPVGGGV